jgi:hypothetical protein
MNRTLRRPMFRMGGSTNEGITSGLDAPRKPFKQGTLPYNMADLVKQSQEQAMDPPEGEGLSRFLINFGLNLASTPPMGKGFSGLISTAAGAAKEPTAQLFKDLDEQRLSKKAAEADLFKTLLEGNIDIAESAAEGTGDAIAKKGVKLQIADDIETTMDLIFKLENKKKNKPDAFTDDDSLLLDKKKLRLQQLTKNDEVMQSLLTDDKYTQRIMRKIKENLLNLEVNGSPKYSGDDDPKLLEDMFMYYQEFFKTGKFPEFKADGGRAGYQVGGGVMGGGEDMGANRVTETATTPEPQKIDFDTLRARLPQEIGDDIVRLIAASPEALEDFATIATQQDVDMFNQKYNVNLVLPQEA